MTRLRALFEHILHAFHLFSRRQKIVFGIAALVCVVTFCSLVYTINRSFTVLIPAHGGAFSEGVIGVPRFVNPLLALSDTDRDMVTLIYSGLMKIGTGGALVPDLASGYTLSDDGLTYTFTLRSATWHDGKPITADDVVFTIEKAQEPATKSPKRSSWEGVSVKAIDTTHVEFTLKHPYGGFLENATIGILPKHIWQNVDAESFPFFEGNTEPVGSGPYRIEKIEKDTTNVPTSYTLRSFDAYTLGAPYIDQITLRFYPNEDELLAAYQNHAIDATSSVPPENAQKIEQAGGTILRSAHPLPRIFALFFNQNENKIFLDSAVRKALSTAIDREGITKNILFNYAEAIDGPLPPGVIGAATTTPPSLGAARFTEAKKILEKAGWEFDGAAGIYKKTTKQAAKKGVTATSVTQELSFSIATVDTPELKAAAEAVKSDWVKLGAKVTLNIFEIGDLNQTIIRPRKYDVLFFGEIVGRDPDPFAFWDSSERLDPGLNVALYTNTAVDKILESARSEGDKEKRAIEYAQFDSLIRADAPAAFVYAPYFLYGAPSAVHGISLDGIASGSDRFLSVANWYIEQDRVWKIFAPKTTNQ